MTHRLPFRGELPNQQCFWLCKACFGESICQGGADLYKTDCHYCGEVRLMAILVIASSRP
jgi:hypothetical protein